MTEVKKNGRWQIAFWVMSVVIVGGTLTLISYVIANEDKRVASEKQIVETIHAEDDKTKKEIKQDVNEKLTEVKLDIKELQLGQRIMSEKMSSNQTELLVAIESLKK